MMLQSLSRSRLFWALGGPILLIQVILIIPLLLIYLCNTQLESQEQANLRMIQLKASSAQLKPKHCPKPSEADENFHCPVGLHACTSCPRICIEQQQNCDGTYDCPDKSDESSCVDTSGILDKMFLNIINNSRKLSAPALAQANGSSQPQLSATTNGPAASDAIQILDNSTQLLQLSRTRAMAGAKPDSCSEKDFYRNQCPCVLNDARVVICIGLQFREVPSTLKSSVYKILMSNNSITSIDNVLWPRSLSNLVLANNRISKISNSTFELAPNLSKMYIMQNEISHLELDAFKGLQFLRFIQFQRNRLTTFDTRMLIHTPIISNICLSENQIDLPDDTNFSHCRYLTNLMLDHNKITKIRAHWFSNVSSLGWLSLAHNEISYIEEKSFEWNYELEELNLSFNKIQVINRIMFATRLNIQRLYLSNNPLKTLPEDAFSELLQLESLNLTGVILNHIHRNTFTQLSRLHFIYFAKFGYCHYANHSRVCRPSTDGLSSTTNLLAFSLLKYGVWIVAFVCTLGNVFVFVWRSVSTREDRTLSLFIRNLSLADLLMGIYLFVIGWQDVKFKDEYNKNAIEWMSSWGCKAIGFLAIFSSELSVFILMIITIERYRSILSIKPFDEYQQSLHRRARIYLCLAWLLSFAVAGYPLLGLVLADEDYYSTNGLCMPLHIDQPYTSGWQYSAFVYLGLNFTAVLVIMVLYARMYTLIMSTRHMTRPALLKAEKREDAILAIRFYFIVATDCLCWIPIVVIKILALARTDISSAIYGWLVVFIIPINSALNPIIYTLATPSSLRAALCRFFDRCCLRFDMTPHLAGYSCCGLEMKKRNSGQDPSTPYKRSSPHSSITTQSDTSPSCNLRALVDGAPIVASCDQKSKGSEGFFHACLSCMSPGGTHIDAAGNRNKSGHTNDDDDDKRREIGPDETTLSGRRRAPATRNSRQVNSRLNWRRTCAGSLARHEDDYTCTGSEYLASRRYTNASCTEQHSDVSNQSYQSGQLIASRSSQATNGSKDSRTCLLSNHDGSC